MAGVARQVGHGAREELKGPKPLANETVQGVGNGRDNPAR
jgi:hypothetical protein